MDNENLKELIFRIHENDRQALSELYQEMKTSVYALALVYTKSEFEAEDIMQNTFLKIWSSAASFKGKNAKSWIMTITRNLSLDWLRTCSRKNELTEDIPSSADCFEKIAVNETIKDLFSRLDENERETVLMYSYGFTFSEIAAVVKKPRTTVQDRYSRAMKKLRELSGGDKDER